MYICSYFVLYMAIFSYKLLIKTYNTFTTIYLKKSPHANDFSVKFDPILVLMELVPLNQHLAALFGSCQYQGLSPRKEQNKTI